MLQLIVESQEKSYVVVKVLENHTFSRRVIIQRDVNGNGSFRVDEGMYKNFEQPSALALRTEINNMIQTLNLGNKLPKSKIRQTIQVTKKTETPKKSSKPTKKNVTISLPLDNLTAESKEPTQKRAEEATKIIEKIKAQLAADKYEVTTLPIAERNNQYLRYITVYKNTNRVNITSQVKEVYVLYYTGEIVGGFINKSDILKFLPVNQESIYYDTKVYPISLTGEEAWEKSTKITSL